MFDKFIMTALIVIAVGSVALGAHTLYLINTTDFAAIIRK
jgi:hypothetical protein